ncbi:ATP-binding protein [Krasilnikoviella flava]|uniref:Bacterial condensin subunit MukB n=1 Tax=Krasilnikoviella flava TaxID=526729 RepID=A0A1T5KWK8_9MICO|nr:SbcC/MukB-like Walker B domain-containing protein [Krasilnikoviella flava]SKC68040.1 bacterial condensin subunit MukB [Krasilnikoviella flava]
MTITSDPAEQVAAPRMQQSLFGLIPTASDGRQWTARSMQLVSWGGYHGYHEVRFAGTTTLLTGASGSGKSTLLDAYIALMMSHTTPFNGASNTATSGRARGQEQRNVVSYARGKLDEERTAGSARAKDRVLRGEASDTWSGIAMTWSSQAGERFTALRAWYVPRGAQRTDETVAVRAVVDADFSLRDLEPLAAQRFGRTGLTAAGLTTFDTDKAFAIRLHAALGIGAAGDGEKAMQLLGRIQAGQQITTVDSLYKAMVLEEPETIRVAERAVEHFDELSEVRAEMDTAQRQVDVLRPMLEHRAAIDDAAAQRRVVDALGPDGGPDGGVTPFTAWRDRTQLDLLRAGEAENRAQHKAAAERVAVAEERLTAAQGELEQVRADQRRNGGDAIEAAERDVRAAGQRLAEVRRARAELEGHLAPLERDAGTRRELDALHADARRYLDERDTHTDALSEAVVEAAAREKDAMRALAELEREEASLKARRGNVPRELHEAREALARAAGMRAQDVPFVGELLEVRGEYEPWRDAIGLALGGLAVTMLVDEARLDAFRAAIDAVRSPVRVRFEGVPTGLALHEETDRALLPGRLEVKAGPFGGWLAGRLAERFAYVCVDDPTELAHHDLALTRSGQTSEGRRGAHGGQGRASVLGFSNHRRLEQLAEQIGAAHQELRQASEALAGARLRQKGEADHFVAYSHALRAAWDDLDVRGAEERLGERQERLETLVAGSDVLRALKADEDRLRARVDELYRERAAAQQRVTELGAAWEQLSDQVDQVADAVEHADAGGIEPTPEQVSRLAELMAQVGWSGVSGTSGSGLADLTTAVAAVVRELDHEREAAQEAERAARAALAALFERFNDTWPDPNRSADPDGAYADFLRIYEELEYQQLYRLRDKWSAHLRQMSGDQLTRLNNGIAQAVAEIRDRMEPVNAILATLPFRDEAHRLRITATPVEAGDVVSFRRRLRELAAVPAGDVPLAEHERRYDRMRRLVDRIRPDSPERRRLVDVRDHVRVSAECVDRAGNHVSVYDHIAGKSGGESQELVAFIVGAALRYQLGDAGAERPRYAPVFLDEAFIKADARFAGRAVGAWRGLGFQLVVGAPLDKVSALEPHADVVLQAIKDATGRSRLVTLVGE